MGSVTFHDKIDYTGNSRTYNITDTSYDQILIYNDKLTSITLRSIRNFTDNNYIVVLYYKNSDNAFGRSYINITSDLRDITYVKSFFDTIN